MNLYTFEVSYIGGIVSTINIVAPSLVEAVGHLRASFRFIAPASYSLVNKVAA